MNSPCRKSLRQLFALLFLILSVGTAVAHNSSKGITAVKMQLFPDNADVTFAISFADTDLLVKLDKNANSEITGEEMATALMELKEIATKDLEFFFDGKRVMAAEAKPSIQESYFEVSLKFTNVTTTKIKLQSPLIRRLTPEHQEMVTFQDEHAKDILVRTLTAANNEVELTREGAQTVASAEAPNAARHTFFAIFKAGIYHILTGYDHLLFLFALLVMCESFWAVAKIITCFTIAHSMTLAVAAFGLFPVNSRIIEPMIAATIVYVGIENLLRLKTIQWRWLITFMFGLIHGLGFATGLRDLGLGSGNIILPVISFNLGVEFGQICVASLVLPILWRLKKHPEFAPRWVPACSLIVVALGGYWFVQRVWL